MPKPYLSIGIIFKDNIRSLEHCLSALQPLREAIPCELVMADTGSTDGSRAVAEKYADILFDFPWVNDFAAARNAVIDRCTGRWYLTVDSDEYFTGDATELAGFLRANNRKAPDICTIVIRNYGNYELEGPYTDFMAMRMVRMSSGLRYEGSIHERWNAPATRLHALKRTVFDHDGYVGLNEESGREKRARNIQLIREDMKNRPRVLMPRLQFIESGATETDLLDQLREAMALVEEQADGWQMVGPAIFRHAVYLAWGQKLPELEEWTGRAYELFPESLYTRVDVNYASFMRAGDSSDYAACAEYGEAYLRGIEDYRKGKDMGASLISVVKMSSPYCEQQVRILLARAYLRLDDPQRAYALLDGLDGAQFDGRQTSLFVQTLREVHARTEADTARLVTSVWKGITQPKPNQQRADQRRQTFLNEERAAFQQDVRIAEKGREDYRRLSCTLFAPLEGKSELGHVAAVLAEKDPNILTEKLAAVEDWSKTPVCTLGHALECGVKFPLPGKPLQLEVMDNLAGRLSRDGFDTAAWAVASVQADLGGNPQDLAWARAVVLAAVRGCKWQDEKQGIALARAFVGVERVFLVRCYAPEMLCEEGMFLLPSMHRFAWYCARAFDALEAGDPADYARLLRKGLTASPSMKSMAEFLTEHTPQLRPAAPGELLALAEKVREMLSQYAPDDPAVIMIKQSAAYLKVAHLIEGPELGIYGGLAQ